MTSIAVAPAQAACAGPTECQMFARELEVDDDRAFTEYVRHLQVTKGVLVSVLALSRRAGDYASDREQLADIGRELAETRELLEDTLARIRLVDAASSWLVEIWEELDAAGPAR